MSKLSPTYFAASVVLALIGTSAAAVPSIVSTPRVAGGTVVTVTPQSPSRTSAAPIAPSSTPTSTGGDSSTGTSSGTATDGTTTGSTTSNTTAAGGTATTTPSLFPNRRASGVIVIDNGTAGGVEGMNANGERVGGQVIAEGLSGSSLNALADNPDLIVIRSGSSVELSAAEQTELRKRQSIGKNQQRLNTIAPRTNIDRTAQMPDDPPSPALTTSR